MRVSVHLASYLRELAGGCGVVALEGEFASLGDVLAALWVAWPGLRHRVTDETGRVRQHVNLFVGQENSRMGEGLATRVRDGVEVWILPAVSGGAFGEGI